jgi:hypothetical protein
VAGEINVDDIFIRRSEAYSKRRNIVFAEQLGSGIQGVVRVAEDNRNFGRFAVKIHFVDEAYRRELSIYRRLAEAGVVTLRGFNVPQLLGWDDACRAIEMSIVSRPFVLDFGGAWLEDPPEFSMQQWAYWEDEKLEQFGPERWKEVKAVLALLATYGVYMHDVTPTNIAFRD